MISVVPQGPCQSCFSMKSKNCIFSTHCVFNWYLRLQRVNLASRDGKWQTFFRPFHCPELHFALEILGIVSWQRAQRHVNNTSVDNSSSDTICPKRDRGKKKKKNGKWSIGERKNLNRDSCLDNRTTTHPYITRSSNCNNVDKNVIFCFVLFCFLLLFFFWCHYLSLNCFYPLLPFSLPPFPLLYFHHSLFNSSPLMQVFFASAAPPVRYSNVYGIDIPTRTELIAHGRTEDEIGTYTYVMNNSTLHLLISHVTCRAPHMHM